MAFPIDSLGIGGTETNMVRVATLLDRARFPVTVVYSRGGPLLDRLHDAGVPTHQLVQPGFKSARLPGALRTFRRWLTAERIDVVHTHDIYSNVFAALAHRRHGPARLVVSRRWGVRQYGRALTWANRWSYGRADLVLGNSAGVGASLHDDEGVPAGRVAVIPNFAADAAFGDAADARELRERLGLPAGVLVVGSIANLTPVKSHGLLLRAIAALPGFDRPVHVALIGEGSERGAIEALARELGIADRIHLAGSIPDATRFHQAFDVSVLTSLSEGFPNTLVEAMAAGRPVVATDVGGVADAVLDNRTGFLVASGDVAAFAERLARLLRDGDLRGRLGAAGRAHARASFHAGAIMPRIESLYRDLVARGGAR